MVYGSRLDFQLLRRLKEDYRSIGQVISDNERFVIGTGLHYGKVEEYDSSTLMGRNIIEAQGIHSFFINPCEFSIFMRERVSRIRDQRIFIAPMLLVRKGLNTNNLTMRGAISSKDLLFKDGVTSIKVNKDQDVQILYDLLSVMSSELCSYYAIHTFSSVGVEREQVKDYEKYSIPYLELDSKDIVVQIEALKKKQNSQLLIDPKIEGQINEHLSVLNNRIFEYIELSDMEKATLEYSMTINLPMITNSGTNRYIAERLKYKDSYLHDYASIFEKRFRRIFDKLDKFFSIEIWYSQQIVGMIFKIMPSVQNERIKWIDKQSEAIGIIPFLIRLGTEKLTDQLFFQKDIRGFEEDQFYIFKTNEKHLWHKAIGYLDVEYFIDAILRAGGQK